MQEEKKTTKPPCKLLKTEWKTRKKKKKRKRHKNLRGLTLFKRPYTVIWKKNQSILVKVTFTIAGDEL